MTGSGSDVFQRFLDKWRYNNGSSDPILGVFKPFKADNHELKLNLEIKLKNCNPMFFIWFKSFVQGKDYNSDQEQKSTAEELLDKELPLKFVEVDEEQSKLVL
ncbi:hypothetical protein GQ457_01G012110 [Hibiscus cannabinus]